VFSLESKSCCVEIKLQRKNITFEFHAHLILQIVSKVLRVEMTKLGSGIWLDWIWLDWIWLDPKLGPNSAAKLWAKNWANQ
jgi:hypothetical protein